MKTHQLLRALAALGVASAALACGFTSSGLRDEAFPGEDASFVDASKPGADASRADARGDDAEVDALADASSSDADAAPDAGAATAVGPTTVAATSLTVDLVSPGDGAIQTDGSHDGVFEVEVTGPAIALAMIRTDAAGMPSGGQQWDTWVGVDVIPAALGTGFAAGTSTWQLGVFDGAGLRLNDADGRLALAAGEHALRLAAADPGSLVAGSYFRIVAQRPDGVLVHGPVFAY